MRGFSRIPYPRAFGAAVIVAAVFLLYSDHLRLALVGHDTYPIILAARIESAADAIGTFTEELMDGRYTQGRFYRPVLNLSFAADYAVHGLRPWGYHLTDLLILACCAALLSAIAGGGGGRAFGLAGIAAAFFFAAHPVHLNILPVVARRGDTLSLLFLAAALLAGRRGGRSAPWIAGALTLLAVGAKEAAAIAPALLFLDRLLRPDGARRNRWAGAAVAAGPSAAAVLLFLGARSVVLGGLGGHASLSPLSFLGHCWLILPEFQRSTFYPIPFLSPLLPGHMARGAAPLLFLLITLLLLRRSPRRREAALAWGWMILGWLVHGLSLAVSPWYALHTVAPFAVLAGLVAAEGWERLRSGAAAARIGGAAAAALVLVLFAVNLRSAPPFRFHPEWRDASRRTRLFLNDLDRRLDAAPEGSTIEMNDLPHLSRYRRGSPIFLVAALTDYTVQAYAELVHPDRKVRVSFPRPDLPPAGPEETLVLVTPRR